VRATWEEILDTAEVEVFLVLAEELHFGHTAERLHLPQPRVSRLIARLDSLTTTLGPAFGPQQRRKAQHLIPPVNRCAAGAIGQTWGS
jgi:Bacterial regulatory helix-turn-helix protein, lysR family